MPSVDNIVLHCTTGGAVQYGTSATTRKAPSGARPVISLPLGCSWRLQLTSIFGCQRRRMRTMIAHDKYVFCVAVCCCYTDMWRGSQGDGAAPVPLCGAVSPALCPLAVIQRSQQNGREEMCPQARVMRGTCTRATPL